MWLILPWLLGGTVVKNLPASTGSIPGLQRAPGVRNGNPFQYSCLENSMNRGVWQATVHGVAKSQTRLSNWACMHFNQTRTIKDRKIIVWTLPWTIAKFLKWILASRIKQYIKYLITTIEFIPEMQIWFHSSN